MKTHLHTLVCTALCAFGFVRNLPAQGTAFTYQGRLNDGAGPAAGIYDLRFTIYDAGSGGSALAGPLTRAPVAVSNGLFTVTLDFGTGVFTGPGRWLEIGVRTNGSVSPHAPLAPRQSLTPSPHAIYAGSAGTVATVSWNSINGVPVNLMSNMISSIGNQPLELKANGQRALRIEPTTNGTPNIIGGSQANQVDSGVVGATISGGGTTNLGGTAYPNHASGNFSTIGGGAGNLSRAFVAVIGGGVQNTIDWMSDASTISGGYGNLIESNTYYGTIGGGVFNSIEAYAAGAFVGAGWDNTNGTSYSFIGAGIQNLIQPTPGSYGNSAIVGGALNTMETNVQNSFIAGGFRNLIQSGGYASGIGGGQENKNGSSFSVIAGGQSNTIEPFADNSSIGGGWLNYIQAGADQSVIAGGNAGQILSGARESFVGGGFANTVQTNAGNSFIGGGVGNTIGINSGWSIIGGGENNSVQLGASHATVAGGTANVASGGGAFVGGGIVNRAEHFDAVVAGGGGNVASGYRSFIGGGEGNVISNSGSYATIAGGSYNAGTADNAAIGGGRFNTNRAPGGVIGGGLQNLATNSYATVGGGFQNVAGGNFNGTGDSATVAGGYQNTALGNNAFVGGGFANYARGDNSTIAGGWLHTNQTGFGTIGGGQQNLLDLFARFSVVGGGDNNSVRSNSPYAVIAGGQLNRVGTNASYATIPGGFSNEVAAVHGFAAGRRAKARHPGAFVWADSNDADFASTASNQFLIRASGGIGIGTNNPTAALEVAGTIKAGAFQDNGSGFMGTFNGNGGGLSNVNATAVGGLASSNFWLLGGNSGNPNTILGTFDPLPLSLFAGNQRVLRLETSQRSTGIFTGFVGANLLGGSQYNWIWTGVLSGTIAGGGLDERTGLFNHVSSPNTVSDDFGTIGGGLNNTVGNTNLDTTDVRAATVAGGEMNWAGGNHATVAGGGWNTASGISSFIGGGGGNTLGGPWPNTASGDWSAVVGGWNNTAGGYSSAVGGGGINNASGRLATIPGGYFNAAAGELSFAAGSHAKANHLGSFVWSDAQSVDFASTANNQFSIRASGGVRLSDDTPNVSFGATTRQMLNLWDVRYGVGVQSGTLYFRADNFAQDNGFAWFRGGSHVDAIKAPGPGGQLLMGLDDRGLFLFRGDVNWSLGGQLVDNQGGSIELGPKFSNTGQTPFIDFHFGGGSVEDFNVRLINNASGQLEIYRSSSGTAMARFNSGGLTVNGTFVSASDRNVKAGFEPVDAQAILEKVAALPITRWHYTNDAATPHLGPVAQDFQAAFAVGPDDKHIASVDADGVALAAIQGLNQKVEEQRSQLKRKESEIRELKDRLEALEKIIRHEKSE